MPTLNSEIKEFVAGDDLDVIRTIGNLPAGQTIAKAWFTVKTEANLLLDDTNIVFQKIITPANVLGEGQVTDIGISGIGAVIFELTDVDTAKLTAKTVFFFDIQVLTSAEKLFTPELGRIRAEIQRTRSVV